VTSADVSAKYVHQDKGPDYPIDVDSIFFTFDPATAVQPSAPPPQVPYQPYSQPFAPPPSYGFTAPPPSYGFSAPPPYEPPAYSAFSSQ